MYFICQNILFCKLTEEVYENTFLFSTSDHDIYHPNIGCVYEAK